MGRVWKEIIRPGSYYYLDAETKAAKKLVVTPESIKHWHDSGNEMLSAGLSIPIPVEHQLDLGAMTASQRQAAQLINNAGWVTGYKVLPGNRLFGECSIEDPELEARLPKTIKYTSPWINTFTDGEGRKWEGVISHLALTSRPRITQQDPFPKGATAVPLSLGADALILGASAPPLPPSGLFISRAGLLSSDAPPVPHYPMAFSVLSGAALAEDYDEPPDEATDTPQPSKSTDDPDLLPDRAPGELPGEEAKEMGLVDVLVDVVSALWGVELPEDTDESNLLQNMIRALMDHLKATKGGGAMLPEDTTMPNKETTPSASGAAEVTQEQPPFYMSLEEISRIADPEKKKMASAMLSMHGQVQALSKSALEAAKKRRQARIERLAARVKGAGFGEKLLAQSASVPLSLQPDGSVNDPMSATLDLLEQGIVSMPQLLLNPAVTEQAHPEDFTGGKTMSEERRNQIVEEQCRAAGIVEKKAS